MRTTQQLATLLAFLNLGVCVAASDRETPASLIYGPYNPGFPEVNVVYQPVGNVAWRTPSVR